MNDDTAVPRWLAVVGEWGWRLVAGTAAAVIAGYLLLKFSVVVVPVVLALFLAAPLEPLTAKLRARGWKPVFAALLVFVGSLALVVGAVAWISTRVAHELDDVGDRVDQGVEDVQEWLTENFDVSEEQLERIEDQFTGAARTTGEGGVARSVIGGARFAVQVIGGFVLMLFTLFFILKDGHKIAGWVLDRAPPRYREDLTVVGNSGGMVLRHYLVAVALCGLIDAILIGIVLQVMGVPLVLPLVLLTFIGGFVPIVGAFVAGIVATLVTLVTNGFGDALVILIATVAVQQIEGNILQPLIFGPVVKVHELVTVLAVAAGLAVGGILGAFLAVPIVALVANIGHFYRTRETLPGVEPPAPDAPP